MKEENIESVFDSIKRIKKEKRLSDINKYQSGGMLLNTPMNINNTKDQIKSWLVSRSNKFDSTNELDKQLKNLSEVKTYDVNDIDSDDQILRLFNNIANVDSQNKIVRAQQGTKIKFQNSKDIMNFEQFVKHYDKDPNDKLYNIKRAYEIYKSNPTKFEDPEIGIASKESDGWHFSTVDPSTGIFLKHKNHPTINKELQWYNSPEGKSFKERFELDSLNDYFRYVPKRKQGGILYAQQGVSLKRYFNKAIDGAIEAAKTPLKVANKISSDAVENMSIIGNSANYAAQKIAATAAKKTHGLTDNDVAVKYEPHSETVSRYGYKPNFIQSLGLDVAGDPSNFVTLPSVGKAAIKSTVNTGLVKEAYNIAKSTYKKTADLPKPQRIKNAIKAGVFETKVDGDIKSLSFFDLAPEEVSAKTNKLVKELPKGNSFYGGSMSTDSHPLYLNNAIKNKNVLGIYTTGNRVKLNGFGFSTKVNRRALPQDIAEKLKNNFKEYDAYAKKIKETKFEDIPGFEFYNNKQELLNSNHPLNELHNLSKDSKIKGNIPLDDGSIWEVDDRYRKNLLKDLNARYNVVSKEFNLGQLNRASLKDETIILPHFAGYKKGSLFDYMKRFKATKPVSATSTLVDDLEGIVGENRIKKVLDKIKK